VDENGFMHVDRTHISKEAVNPYYGWEIPGFAELGLRPARVYWGYRPGEELARAAGTFNGLPLLLMHHPDSAGSPQKEFRVGSMGTGAAYNAPYLDNALSITDAGAIEAVESGECRELSCAYMYDPDFTPGEFGGERYDFVMRNIRGNHVALVHEGRAGPDVAVADARTVDTATEERRMGEVLTGITELKDVLETAEADIRSAVEGAVGASPAPDGEPGNPPGTAGDPPEARADQDPGAPQAPPSGGEGGKGGGNAELLGEVAAWLDSLPDQEGAARARTLLGILAPPPPADAGAPPAGDDTDPNWPVLAEIEKSKRLRPEEGEPGSDGGSKDPKTMTPAEIEAELKRLSEGNPARYVFSAGDSARAALEAVKAELRRELDREYRERHAAAQDVAPLIGAVDAMAYDSAGDIYRQALRLSGRPTEVRELQALRELTAMVKAGRAAARMGADSAPRGAAGPPGPLEESFPALERAVRLN
jgi:hypothetical protein